MGDTAGLNDASTYDIIMGVVYGITAAVLIVTAYIIYTKQFRRKKMEAVNTVHFETAKYNIYTKKTQLLVQVPVVMNIVVELLDGNENQVSTLLSGDLTEGEHIVEFDPTKYEKGAYFFKLVGPTTQILKKIVIS